MVEAKVSTLKQGNIDFSEKCRGVFLDKTTSDHRLEWKTGEPASLRNRHSFSFFTSPDMLHISMFHGLCCSITKELKESKDCDIQTGGSLKGKIFFTASSES